MDTSSETQAQEIFVSYDQARDSFVDYLKAGTGDLMFKQLSLSPSVEEAPSEAAGRHLTAGSLVPAASAATAAKTEEN